VFLLLFILLTFVLSTLLLTYNSTTDTNTTAVQAAVRTNTIEDIPSPMDDILRADKNMESSESEVEAISDHEGMSDSDWSGLTHLVLVAGHAVLTSTDVHNVTDAKNWYVLDYQKGQVSTYVSHIKRGVELCRGDSSCLLVFSGGETRIQAGPRSEAQSYWMVAEHENWWSPRKDTSPQSSSVSTGGRTSDVSARSVTEEFARDSFENLLFSVCRFKEVTGRYPERITVIGFSFKRARFVDLHREALRFPASHFAYVGIDPLENQKESDEAVEMHRQLTQAELVNSYLPFQADPYGCRSKLSAKKRARNPFRRSHSGYQLSCPEMTPILKYCRKDIYNGSLPWTSILQ